jgi:acyl-CoA thioesterase
LRGAGGPAILAPPMSTRFDRDTEVGPAHPPDGSEARADTRSFLGRIDRGWWVVRGPNGGYVAALFLRALSERVEPDRAPRSLTLHYTAPPAEGPVRVETRVERVGRSLSTVSGRLVQDGRLLALGIAAFSRPRPGPTFEHATPPEVPPPDACPALAAVIPIHERFDYRWAVGSPPGSGAPQALCGGWIRHAEPRLADAALVAAFTDAWPPACFSWASGPDVIGPVPTIDLTIHFRRTLPIAEARPDDFYLALFRSRVAAEGFVEEDGEVWSRDGRLLVQSRQRAALV